MTTLRKIFSLPEFKTISLVAGKEGIDRTITGVNVTESVDLAEFFRQNELIVTTGIDMANDFAKLINMVETAFQRQACGMVINTGPYIPFIPERILNFADEQAFPMFQMPWEYRVADFLKLSVQFLMTEQNKSTNGDVVLSEILFNPDFNDEDINKELTKRGFKNDTTNAIVVCELPNHVKHQESIMKILDKSLHDYYECTLSMVFKNQYIVLVDTIDQGVSHASFSKIVQDVYHRLEQLDFKALPLIAKGEDYTYLSDLKKSYDEALKVIQLNRKHANYQIYSYQDLGAYKLILGARNRRMTDKYHHDTLGKLYQYDKSNETDYVAFLRIYLEEDGRTINISRKKFIHRNTVLYKIKKIESILNMKLDHTFTKTTLTLAFMIEDLRM
ncbi:PucR family transcriptional regulator [Terrilactibacillus laevilacticus]|uniref:PucR family transcriptional regulator n=1 Tax=Terrilactibacillus laevilacticus TaxID=1380157 RepID=UPI0011479CAD|nr:PucR family transcriptional regulator [Terrilactibacillus laevilacticus]